MNAITQRWNCFLERRITRLVLPDTLVGPERVHNLYVLAKRVEKENIPGDVIECGVCNGGTAALLARFATRSRFARTMWLLDSFQGMPVTTMEDGEAAKAHIGKEVGDIGRVKRALERVGADMSRVRILPGWFQDTFSLCIRLPNCRCSTLMPIGTSRLNSASILFMTVLLPVDSSRSMTTGIGRVAARPWTNSLNRGGFPTSCDRWTTPRTGSKRNDKTISEPRMRTAVSSRVGESGPASLESVCSGVGPASGLAVPRCVIRRRLPFACLGAFFQG